MFDVSNPSAAIDLMQAYNKYYRFFGSFGFKYKFNDKFSATTMIGITYDKVRENVFVPRKGISNDSTSNAVIDSRMSTQVKRLSSLFTDTRATYSQKFGNHNLGANLGFRYQHNKADQIFALGFNSATDELVSVQNGLNALRQIGGGVGEWSWINIYGNIDYSFKDKFFVNFSTAMDASSRFGKEAEEGIKLGDNPFAIMPSLSGAWLISSEHFMADSRLSFLKLRASVSKTGNDDIGNYSWRQTYSSQNLLGMQGLLRSGIANPSLQWENVARLNLGLDAGFWNDRVQFTVDFWKNNTTKMLVYKPVESIFGFSEVLTNDGEMSSNGIDLSLTIRAINQPNLKWDITANASTFTNKVTNIPGDRFITQFAGATMLTEKGQSASQFFGLTTNGVFASDAEAMASGLSRKKKDGSLVPFTGGDVRFNDLNGDRIIDDADRSVLGGALPDWFGGINNRVAWKRFTFQALITFSAGGEVYNQLRHQLESASGTNNQLLSVANRWRIDGQTTNTPKATWGDPMGNAEFSDRWIEDGSYLRLRNLSVEYDLPIKNQKFIKNINLYATGYNLITFTEYLGYDPEFSANPSVFAQGIDAGFQPIHRSVMFGIKLGL
jgi:TonB-linked SusC/RagA family outer membrane protein